MTLPLREIGGGLLSAAILLAARYGAGWGVAAAGLAGLAAWLGWQLAVGTDIRPGDFPAPEPTADALREQLVARFHDRVAGLVDRVVAANAAIPSNPLTERLDQLAVRAQRLAALVSEQSVFQANRFVDQILVEGVEIAEDHARLVAIGADRRIEPRLIRRLDTMVLVFDGQIGRLQDGQALEVEVRLEALASRLDAFAGKTPARDGTDP